ncbi:hypothetical protein ACS0TY_017354 [Phlomoides rotata]
MMILYLSVSKSRRTVTLSLVLEKLKSEAKFNNIICGSISGVRRIYDPFSKVVDQVGISLLLASAKEGLAFAHCTTCKSPYYIRVHGTCYNTVKLISLEIQWIKYIDYVEITMRADGKPGMSNEEVRVVGPKPFTCGPS